MNAHSHYGFHLLMVPSKQTAQPRPDRRVEILDAAEICFSRTGFHQTSMNEICVEAGMSPGNLYRYFRSKEAIIAGIAERSHAQAAEKFNAVANAPNFHAGMRQLARHHFVERSDHELRLCAEIMAESRRNPAVARVFTQIEDDIRARLEVMLREASERGEVSRNLDFPAAAEMLMIIADGMTWHRASDPKFDAEKMLPYMFQMIRHLLDGGKDPSDQENA